MGMLLVVPDHNALVGAVVVDGGTMFRTASLRDAFTGGTSQGRGVQPGKDWMSRRMTVPLSEGWTNTRETRSSDGR